MSIRISFSLSPHHSFTFTFPIANPMNDNIVDPHSGFTTHDHEAGYTVDDSEFNSSSDDEIDRYKEQGRIFRARLEGITS